MTTNFQLSGVFSMDGNMKGRSYTFTPKDISGLTLWLDADSINANNNDLITTWNDISSNSYDVTQNTESKKPIYKTPILSNNKPAVYFDGDYQNMSASLESNFDLSSFTIIFVANWLGSDHPICGKNENAEATNSPARRKLQVNRQRFISGGDNNYWDIDSPPGYNTWIIGVWRILDVNNVNFYKNGFDESITKVGSPNITTFNNAPLKIGMPWASTEAEYFLGYLAELMIYNNAISNNDRQSIEQYLNNKYSIY